MLKKTFLSLVAGITLLSTANAQMTNETMTVGTATRQYRQYLPSGFNAATEPGLPLVIALHGLGDDYINFSSAGFQYLADTARFIVVYPNGTLNGWSQRSWNNGTILSSTADDIHFISRIIDSMYIKYNISLAHVYVTGFSMGGIMSYHLLCAMPERIAAIASVSGTMSDTDVSTCDPGRPVPVMHMHGTADGTVPYSTGKLPSLSLVPTTLNFWQNNNGCSDSTVTAMPDIVTGDSITVDFIQYNTCTKPVNFWRENGADHQWLYRPVNDIDATTQIWLFFRDKVHPSPSPLHVAEVVHAQGVNIATTYNGLNIESGAGMQEIVVTDMQGRYLVNLKGNLGTSQLINLNTYRNQPLVVNVKAGETWYKKKFVLVR